MGNLNLRAGGGALRLRQGAVLAITSLVADMPGGLTVSGTARNPGGSPAGATVTIQRGGATVGTGTVGSDGAWSVPLTGLPPALATYEVSVAYATTARTQFQFKPSALLAPGASSTIACVDGAATNTSRPTFVGRLSNPNGGGVGGVPLPFYVNGVLDGTAVTGSDGAWTYTIQTAISGTDTSPIPHTFEVRPTVTIVSGAATVLVGSPSVPPSDILWADLEWIISGSPVNTTIGRLVAIDANVGDTFTWALTDTAGGRFKIDPTTGMVMAGGVTTDWETAPVLSDFINRGHAITAQVTDADGHTIAKGLTVRVFQAYADRIANTPPALDPSTLQGVLLDINPIAARVNGGAVANGAAVSSLVSSDAGAYSFVQATASRQPVWLADGGNGRPCLQHVNDAKVLTCSAQALARALDGEIPFFTLFIVAEAATVSGKGRILTFGNDAAVASRLEAYTVDDKLCTALSDPTRPLNAADYAQTPPGVSVIAAGSRFCMISGAYSRETAFTEEGFRLSTQGTVDKVSGTPADRKLFFKAVPPENPTKYVGIGATAASLVGKVYRIVLVNRRMSERERFGVARWAKETYGIATTPTWVESTDLDWAGYVKDYDEGFDYASLDAVPWNPHANSGERVPGLRSTNVGSQLIVPSAGPYAGKVIGGGAANAAENCIFLNMGPEVPEMRQHDVMEFRNSFVILKQRAAPAALKPYLYNPNDGIGTNFKDYICAQLISRYGAHQAIYGIWEFEVVMPKEAGPGIWPAVWLFGQQSGTECELDLEEWFGQNPFGVHSSFHDASYVAPGGLDNINKQSGRFYITDDKRAGLQRYAVKVGPFRTTMYLNGRKVREFPTWSQLHTPKYWLLNNTNGSESETGGFAGRKDETTVFPNYYAANFVRHYHVVDQFLKLTGVQSEAQAYFDACAVAGSALSDGAKAAVNDLIAKTKGSAAEWIDGSSKSVWDLLDYLVVPAAESEVAGRIDLKTPSRMATKVGAPGWVANQGVKATKSGEYWDTGLNLRSGPVAMIPSNMVLGVFTLDAPAALASRYAHGTTAWCISPAPSDTYTRVGGSETRLFNGAQGPGLHALQRYSLTPTAAGYSLAAWFNGAETGIFTSAAKGDAFDDANVLIGATSPMLPGTHRVAAVFGGRWMTDSHHRMWNRMLREYLAAIGAPLP